MNNPILAPCLWLNEEAEEAAAFYIETLAPGRVVGRARFAQSLDNPVGLPPGSVMSVDFEVRGQRFTATNGGPRFTINPSISFFVRADSSKQAERLFGALSSGGETLMPLDAYPWSTCYGWTADRFGVSWQVLTVERGDERPPIAPVSPALMFCGAQFGNAMAAMEHWCAVFPRSGIAHVESLGPGKDGSPGVPGVMEARLQLAGQSLIAMDSPGDHAFGFNEAVSLQVLCHDQSDIDHYWRQLSQGGEPSQCGWLKDRFGVSWQVVPKRWLDWLGDNADENARERVFRAMMPMAKLNVATLERAFVGA